MYTGENRPPIDVADQLYLALPTPISKILRSTMMAKLTLLDAQVVFVLTKIHVTYLGESHRDLHRKLSYSGFQLPAGESDFIERLTVRRGEPNLLFYLSSF
jgi:hypothetical protein